MIMTSCKQIISQGLTQGKVYKIMCYNLYMRNKILIKTTKLLQQYLFVHNFFQYMPQPLFIYFWLTIRYQIYQLNNPWILLIYSEK